MTTTITSLTQSTAWKALEAHSLTTRALQLRELFAKDPQRGERLTVDAAGIYLDYSKNLITDETVRLLLELAKESGLQSYEKRSTLRRSAQSCMWHCEHRKVKRFL